MLSFFYDGLLFLYALCLLPKIIWERCVHGKYRETLKARLGLSLPKIEIPPGKKVVWIHAISMGETRAILPLYRLLCQRHPELLIVISSTTETGYAEAKRSLPEAALHFYLPFDFSWNMKRCVRRLHPSYLILVEADLWYHLLTCAKQEGAHLFLINGKISKRSTERFAKIPFFTRRLFALFDRLCVQNALYCERFLSLGAPQEKLSITGNIKLDASPIFLKKEDKEHFAHELGVDRADRVLVIVSTHAPEEEWLLSALAPVWEALASFKVLLIPRHPDRFGEVATLLEKKEIPRVIYSERNTSSFAEKHKARVVLIDAMGLVHSCFQLAEVALVAGSFVSHVGGHNIFEPLPYALPVLFGPYMQGQLDLKQIILEAGAGKEVTLKELPAQILTWYQHSDNLAPYVTACKRLLEQVQGATERTYVALNLQE